MFMQLYNFYQCIIKTHKYWPILARIIIYKDSKIRNMVRETNSTSSECSILSDSSVEVIVQSRSKTNHKSTIWSEQDSEFSEECSPYCQCRCSYRGEEDEKYCPSCRKPVLDTYDESDWEDSIQSTDSLVGNECISTDQLSDGTIELTESDDTSYEGDIEEMAEKTEKPEKRKKSLKGQKSIQEK